MLFNVHGKTNNHNRSIRVNAESAEAAEKIAFGQGLFVTEVIPVDAETVPVRQFERAADVIWKSLQSARWRSMKCLGGEVTSGQFALLTLLGCATWIIDLRTFHFV